MRSSQRVICALLCGLAGSFPIFGAPTDRSANRVVSLAGEWRFLRDGPASGDHPGPLPPLKFSDTIQLPGTIDTNQKGPASNERSTYGLTQPYRFEGTCWYEHDVTVPNEWRGKRVTLFLERTKYTQVWLDGRPIGENPILCTPQEYDLGSHLSPGPHKLTIAVDNKRLPVKADAHQWSGNTQGNWNGIIGRIELRATDLIWLDDVQVYPDAVNRKITVKMHLGNVTQTTGEGLITVSAKGKSVVSNATQATKVQWPVGGTNAEVQLSLGPDAALWDEFHPALHELTVHLNGPGIEDEQRVSFGLRDFATRDRQFTINGRTTFLRGKHDACVFPLTGHPPMEVDGWLKYFRTCQSYGINHIRFHTWTPPEAAFAAADQLGIYLQPELPFWGDFKESVKTALKPEAVLILSRMGNHPSFVMFSMGNEHWGGREVVMSLVAELRALDSRHLYVRGTSAFSSESRQPAGDDYLVTSAVKRDANSPLRQVRGSNAGKEQGHIQTGPANTMTDYAEAIAGAPGPVVSHEAGQYTVFPDFWEIAKYTDVSRAYNLEQYRKKLADAGMLDQNADFARASGALAALCYREEIESCLRTPHHGGFVLLDLQDYPGQGTALVGMLDAFMDSKGIITPEQWRQFCAPTVLLAKFRKYTWTGDETFTADIEGAHYGEQDLPDTMLDWTLKDARGQTLTSGALPAIGIQQGGVRPIGDLAIPLASLTNLTIPAQLRLDLSLAGTPITTSYPLWVYPSIVDTAPPPGVKVVRSFDAAARNALAAGERVVLLCDGRQPLARTVGGGFAPDFWNFQFFHDKPGTMGILCDPASPALAQFPTESHSDWQWFQMTLHAQPLILDALLPAGDHPIVQVIDNYDRDHKLGLVFEARVGPGRLLVCATDLLTLGAERPEARQLLASLLAYAGSDRFDPRTAMSVEALRELFRTTIPMAGCTATASSFEDSWQNFTPPQLIDGNEARGWHADPHASSHSWCQITFPKPTDLHGGEILWDEDKPGYKYIVESSTDGTHWETLCDERENAFRGARHQLAFTTAGVRFVRITILAVPYDHAPAINEVRFYGAE
jgi:hypothetical protein